MTLGSPFCARLAESSSAYGLASPAGKPPPPPKKNPPGSCVPRKCGDRGGRGVGNADMDAPKQKLREFRRLGLGRQP